MEPIAIATAGYMAACAPEGILAQPVAGMGDAVRVRQHAAIVAASPVLWLRLLPVRGPLWESEIARDEPRDPALRMTGEHKRARPVRRAGERTRTDAYDDLPEDVRAALVPLAEQSQLRVSTLMHVAYWAWSGKRRLFVDPSLVPGEPEHALAWREEGRRTKRHLPEAISAMRLRWLKRARLIGGYYGLSPDVDVQPAAVTRRIDRVERQIPESLRPDLGDDAHRRAIEAMGRYLELRDGPLAAAEGSRR